MSEGQAINMINDRFTSKIRSVVEGNLLTPTRGDSDGAMLNEVHLPPQRSLTYDQVSGLKDFKAQLGQDHCHKMRVSVGKEWHVGHQPTAVIADNLLQGRAGKRLAFTAEQKYVDESQQVSELITNLAA